MVRVRKVIERGNMLLKDVIDEIISDGAVLLGRDFYDVKRRIVYIGRHMKESEIYGLISAELGRIIGEDVWVGSAAVETENGEIVKGIWAIKEGLFGNRTRKKL